MPLIDDAGDGDFTLVVTDGEVEARKRIPYDGVLYYSTEERPRKPQARSEFGLDARDVVRRYVKQSGTSAEFDDLIDDVQAALGRVEA